MSIAIPLPPVDGFSDISLSKARELVAFWYARWGACERLSDAPLDPLSLYPWADDLVIFDLVDLGADFRAQQMGRELVTFFGRDCSGTRLSEFPLPYRRILRQALLRASMTRAPMTEHYGWLVDGYLRSCIACAMPVAGGYYHPSQILLSIFYRTLESRRIAATDIIRMTCSTPGTARSTAPLMPGHHTQAA